MGCCFRAIQASLSHWLISTCWCHLLAQLCDLWTWSALLLQPANRLMGFWPHLVMSCSMVCKQAGRCRACVCVYGVVCMWAAGQRLCCSIVYRAQLLSGQRKQAASCDTVDSHWTSCIFSALTVGSVWKKKNCQCLLWLLPHSTFCKVSWTESPFCFLLISITDIDFLCVCILYYIYIYTWFNIFRRSIASPERGLWNGNINK